MIDFVVGVIAAVVNMDPAAPSHLQPRSDFPLDCVLNMNCDGTEETCLDFVYVLDDTVDDALVDT